MTSHKPIMTKQEEIDALKSFVNSLPKDGYLIHWFNDVLPQVENEIRSDFMVSPSLRDTRKYCSDALEAGMKDVNDRIASVQASAQAKVDKLNKQADQIRGNVTHALRQAMRQLEDI